MADHKGPTVKMRKKADLPSKSCAHCGLPFNWRKKWKRDWEQVKFCSGRCRRAAKGPVPSDTVAAPAAAIIF